MSGPVDCRDLGGRGRAGIISRLPVPITAGSHLGPYEVVSPLGAGGMGEVWRARDTKLNREVALKILPEAFALDADRLARFKREAQVLAALNHPHIGAIYGFEESSGIHALVLELVDGPTLADRVAQGPIPLDDALPIAKQIVEALEAAHEQGIIHRDLKPANIKLRPDGTVKVLDFGLAKAVEAEAPATHLTHSPTLSLMATQAGVILGTAAYMSPEQAKGLQADHRSDVFSFGCVLFEMVTGRQAFRGDTAPDILASVLAREPELNALPSNINSRLVDLLRRCFEKNPKRRWQAVGDLRLELDAISTMPYAPAQAASTLQVVERRPPLWRRAVPIAVALIVGGAVVGATMWAMRPAPPRLAVMRFPYNLPEGQGFTTTLLPEVAISHDGTQMAYVANNRVYVRSMAELDARPLAGTEAAEGIVGDLAFSPDGASLAFWSGPGSGLTLRRIAITGGTPVAICDGYFPFGTTWDGDTILFGTTPGTFDTEHGRGIQRVSASGGKPTTIVSLNKDEIALRPQILPGGDAILFTLATGINGITDLTLSRWNGARIVVQSLKSSARKTLIEGGSDARYLSTGHLAYAVGGTLFAVAFDAKRLEVSGAPVPVMEGVSRSSDAPSVATGFTQLSVAENGTVAYVPGPTNLVAASSATGKLALIDRKGVATPLNLPAGPYEFPRVSPDGKRIAVGTNNGREANIWIYELAGNSAIRQLTFGGKNRFPVWSADGERVTFQSDREGDAGIFWQREDGASPAERLTKPEQGLGHIPESWSPDGKQLLFVITKGAESSVAVWSQQDRTSSRYGDLQSVYFAITPTFSPDGKWVAYTQANTTNASAQTFLQPFPATSAKYLVHEGVHPLWTPDGKGIFIKPPPGQPLVLVPVTTQPSVMFGNPESIPKWSYRIRGPNIEREQDITHDGKYFVGVVDAAPTRAQAAAAPQIRIVLNWFEELKQRVPVK